VVFASSPTRVDAALRRDNQDGAVLSIQESLYPELTCFGCGHANPKGFHLRSYRDGDLTVAEFTPYPEHDNGAGFVNGGIIATVLDCHTAAVVLWEVVHRDWKDPSGGPLPFVTAGFDVRFLRPTPLGPPVHLTASPISVEQGEIVVGAELFVEDKARATMTATWKRFRPR
jgi:acyl-coenzyme A thioesterase PaaI-like protein